LSTSPFPTLPTLVISPFSCRFYLPLFHALTYSSSPRCIAFDNFLTHASKVSPPIARLPPASNKLISSQLSLSLILSLNPLLIAYSHYMHSLTCPLGISLNLLFFSQKNTFFFPRKQKQIYSKYLPPLTIHFSYLSGNLCIPRQKNSSFEANHSSLKCNRFCYYILHAEFYI